MFSKDLELSISQAYQAARDQRHEYLTVEHMLLALLENPSAMSSLGACGAVEAILATLASDSVLRRALETEDAGLLFASVWTLDPGHLGFRLWRLLDARDWQDLLDLMATYRALHQVAESSHTELWR